MAKRSKRKNAEGNGNAVTQRPSFLLNREWVLGFILILAVGLAYQPVWYAGFVWDDDAHVSANPCIVGPLGLKEIWTTNAAQFFPLALTTFWVEHVLWGLAPLPYHLVNVLMHAACALLLWRVLLSLHVPGAWLGAALWALHPLQVESVAWITEMKNTESGLFFLLSILFFVKWQKARDLGGQTDKGWFYALTLLFGALAMASKSSTVVLPVVLCLCAWWMEGGWHWRNLLKVAPLFFMSAASVALTMSTANQQTPNAGTPWERNWTERVVTAGDAVWFYLGKLVWPHPLITVYPRWEIDAGQWYAWLPLLAVTIILFILWFKRDSWFRPGFFALAYFLAALLPVLGLVDAFIFRYSLVFDHFQYLAGMGPLALAGAGMDRLADFVIPGRRWLQTSLCAGILLVLGMVSWQRGWAYENNETLWTDALARNPNCWVGHNNLGWVFAQRKQVDEAIGQFQKALELNPGYAEAHNNLGWALYQQARMEEAITQFQDALKISGNYAAANYNLGNALFRKGQVDEAMAQYQRALELNPNYPEAHDNLGIALAKKGERDEAASEFQKALEVSPNDAEAHKNLGLFFAQKGQVDEAISQFQSALEVDPNDADTHSNLGVEIVQRGRVDEAITQFQEALEINPNGADARFDLGNALLQKGRLDDAIEQFQKALKINPNVARVYDSLGVALFQKGQPDEAIVQFQKALQVDPGYTDARNNLTKVEAMQRQAHGAK